MTQEHQIRNKEEITSYIADWFNGVPTTGVNMGGLGKSYDTAIQDLIVKILQYLLTSSITTEEHSDEDRKLISNEMDEFVFTLKENYSGAMVGAAKGVAYQFWVYGLNFMLDKAKNEVPDRVQVFVKL